MKFYKVLLWLALVWQFYLAIPDSTTAYFYNIYPLVTIFNLVFDWLLVILLLMGLLQLKKQEEASRE